jgi:hypothetical protein
MSNYTKKSEELQISDDLYQQLLQTIGNYYIARIAIEFCPPLERNDIAKRFNITHGRLSQIVSEYKKKAEKGGNK